MKQCSKIEQVYKFKMYSKLKQTEGEKQIALRKKP